jgi:hypothetical protein
MPGTPRARFRAFASTCEITRGDRAASNASTQTLSWTPNFGSARFILNDGAIPQTKNVPIKIAKGLCGECNEDGLVNWLDLRAASPAVGNMVGGGGFLPSADLDDNGVIDIRDIGGYRGCCLRARMTDQGQWIWL